ncbi:MULTISPECIES: type IA DNA topoisomerase [unclassified Bacteroides]|uniref:type IA DNA topoisomerase n=1 Tax=unclassified Bacteroides TaxID=2646097 RepID=UPI000E8AEA74|nr:MULTISPECIES: type IA DNA topoisomerase [unclassified Bacteroides]RGN46606.1 type IA DNA topoisomerase [Bacteroides sp. OM05-12]RHR74601.1 type IA DNA topoisomerase [Bacteroides sp. AF16-49]
MKVIIAEKPSVARSIAAIVGATVKKDGYMEGGGYAVTWAFGHLVGLAMPEAYGFTGFRRENLPILPKEFTLIPRQVREGKEYKADSGALKQLKIIKGLFDRADEIIVATDAGREGELIFRFIYNYVECRTSFRRLWISSLTDRAIREGMQALRPGSDYDNLYLSARARSQADWIVGINASQALSISAGSGAWSLGRVQTPTLAMICSRYLENKDFIPQTYFRLKVHTGTDATAFAVLSADKYDSRGVADQTAAIVKAAGELSVTSVVKKEVRQEPPLLYDLTTLQKDANKRHGFSADKTLTIAQGLYESKFISYPRTGSRYISVDVMEEIPHLIATLRAHPKFGGYIDARPDTRPGTRPVNDAKVTDHHALIITEDPARGLSEDQQLVYDMIAGRMLEAFGEGCVKENTAVTLKAGGVHFVAKGSIMLHPGWRNVFGADREETTDEDLTVLPDLTEGDKPAVRDVEVQERQTKPKPLHTEATLLSAMESAGREIENEEEREAMKDAGIGTPATRAAIIETLFSREYIVREKKTLVPTNKGLTVYLAVHDKKIADVAMTGQWEAALAKIGTGDMDAGAFHRSIEVYASQITAELLDMAFARQDNRQSCPCPKCKSGNVVIFNKVAKCQNEACGLTVWRTIAKKELSDTQLISLLTNGKTGIIKGLISGKTGKPFDAAIAFDADYKTVFDFEQKKGKPGSKRKSK